MAVSGTLITRNYTTFRGVDFSNRKDEVNLYRSPDSKNMWKNYRNNNGKCVETRPDIEVYQEYEDSIYGVFFYTYSGVKHLITHRGTKLYDNDTQIYSGMAEHESKFFVYNKNLYIKDGSKYLKYNGSTCQEVSGTIPTTTISRLPKGGGTVYEDVNLLTGVRRNSFVGDGTSKDYYVDSESFDSNYTVRCWVNGAETNAFTTTPAQGKVTFTTAPAAPDTEGQDNVIIQFRKTISGYRERIEKCTLLEVFDNRVFFSGNPDYPNMLWHCSLEDPEYCSDLDYYEEGIDDSSIKALVAGNNALWVMKEPSQSNTTIFYHNPTIDSTVGKVYPSTHSSISIGCVSTGINFNDDICFFSSRGMEAISGDITTEQVLSHRSSMVDSRLLNETNYKELILEEWQGYLLVAIGKHVYLADSRAMLTNNDHNEYEWFYWEFNDNITKMLVDNDILYLVTDKKIYTLTKIDTTIESYWTTIEDEFGYPQYRKTTNKKGCVVDMQGKNITVSAKIDNGSFEKIKDYDNTKGYVAVRIKKKKWKSIQLKFSSRKPFGIFSATLESYVGSYVKR